MVKHHKSLMLSAALALSAVFFAQAAFAVNEGFNPRVMEEANGMIAAYEAQIVKDGPSVEALEWIVKGLKIRKQAYFSDAGAAGEIDAKIIDKLKKIVELDPAHYDANCELIEAGMNAGSAEGAAAKLEALVKSAPARHEARLLRGRALFYAANFDGAIMEITRGVSMIPPEKKADVEYYKKLLETANKYSAVMKKNSPKGEAGAAIKEDAAAADAKALFETAAVYLDPEMVRCVSNIDKGIELLRRSVEKDPNYSAALLKLGETLGDMKGEYKEAMSVLTRLDAVAKEKADLKRARFLRQKYYKLNMSQGGKKKKK